jgi:hypothetical protein
MIQISPTIMKPNITGLNQTGFRDSPESPSVFLDGFEFGRLFSSDMSSILQLGFTQMTKILVLDNYDSFVYTLNGYLQQLGAETDVIRNDAIEASELPALMAKYDGVLISPGPGTPADAGLSIPVVKEALQTNQPVFGVCLGSPSHRRGDGRNCAVCRRTNARQNLRCRARQQFDFQRRSKIFPRHPLSLTCSAGWNCS